MYTVVTREQPPHRHRALIASAILLALTTALAATLVRRRHVEFPVSFQLPSHWIQSKRGKDYVEYRDLRDTRNRREFAILVVANSPRHSAADILLGFLDRDVPTPVEDVPLGSLPGARVNIPHSGRYVHVGVLPPDEAQAVIMQYYTGETFSQHDEETCRRVAESIRATSQS